MGGKRKPKTTSGAYNAGSPRNLLYDWFDAPFVAGIILQRRNLASETHYNTAAETIRQSFKGNAEREVTMAIARRTRLEIRYGRLADGKAYWFGDLNGQASVLRVFAAGGEIECATELELVMEHMRAGVNSSPMSPDFFHMLPEEEEWIRQVKELFQIGSRAP